MGEDQLNKIIQAEVQKLVDSHNGKLGGADLLMTLKWCSNSWQWNTARGSACTRKTSLRQCVLPRWSHRDACACWRCRTKIWRRLRVGTIAASGVMFTHGHMQLHSC